MQNEADLQAWIKQQIAVDGKDFWIAETAHAVTDANGDYSLQFNGTYGVSWDYVGTSPNANAEALKGTVAASPSEGRWASSAIGVAQGIGGTSKHINKDWLFISTERTEGISQITEWRNKWYMGPSANFGVNTLNYNSLRNADFALQPEQISFDVTPYDSYDNYGVAGDKVQTHTTGPPGAFLSNMQYEIEWTDQNGKVVKPGSDCRFSVSPTGTIPSCDFTAPADLTEQTTYVAKLYAVNPDGTRASIPLAQDSFTVDPNKKLTDGITPSYDNALVVPGTPATSSPTLTDADDNPTAAPEGTKYSIPDSYTPPAGYTVTIDENTGLVTVTSPDSPTGDTAEALEVPVVVTYPDKSTDEVTAPFQLDGIPDNQENDPSYTGVTVTQGGNDTIGSPTNTDSSALPDGSITVTPGTDVTSGDYPVTVVVTYPDKTTDTVTTTVTVTEVTTPPADTPDNQENDPSYPDESGKPGTTVTIPAPKNEDGSKVPDGSTFTSNNPNIVVDPNTGEVTVTIPEDATPGTPITGTITVTYPDGTTDEIPVSVDVTTPVEPVAPVDDNQSYIPHYNNGVTVDQDGNATIPVPTYTDGDRQPTVAPDGTTYTGAEGNPDWATVNPDGSITVTPGADVPAGRYVVVVNIKFPDGTMTTVPVPVVVNEAPVDPAEPTTPDNYTYSPNYTGTTVKQGDTAVIAVPTFTTDDGEIVDAPEGTTFTGVGTPSWITVNPDGSITVTPGKDVEPGYYPVTVEITYPDGTKSGATVLVQVVGADETSTPVDPTDPNVPVDPTDPDDGNTDGGNTDGGSTDGGNTDGGNTDGGNTDSGKTDNSGNNAGAGSSDNSGAAGGSNGTTGNTTSGANTSTSGANTSKGSLANTGAQVTLAAGLGALALAAGGVILFARRRSEKNA